MLSTSARLLRLASLMQSRQHWSGPALAEALGVDARTVRRDVGRLRELGYPVDASTGVGGGYALGRGGNSLPPLLLDDDEAVALAIALRTVSASVGGLEETALKLLGKLDQLMPTRLRRRATALHAVTLSLRSGAPLVDAGSLSVLATACRDCRSLRFGYRSHVGTASQRQVQPVRLAHYGRRWYLLAWDVDRTDWRSFRVDRIDGTPTPGDLFQPRPVPPDVAARLERGVAYATHACRISLRLQGSIAELQAALPVWCGVLEAESDTHCLLHVGAESAEGVLAHVLMIGRDVALVDDNALLPELQAALARLMAVLSPSRAASQVDAAGRPDLLL